MVDTRPDGLRTWVQQQIVLVSRRQPDESTKSFLDSIRDSGCQVIVHAADMSSRDEVQAVFDRFGAELKPLGGVIHTAGILDDGLLKDQTWERFEKVLAPKVRGAELLDELTRSLSLDFFILYSSAASVFGSPGQSNYATANAYLDGLASQRRALGLPAISINWGPWTAGMADDERIAKRLSLQGITPLGVSEAHDAMEKLLVSNSAQATVMDVDWRKMRLGMGNVSPTLLEDLTPVKRGAQVGDSEFIAKLKRLQGNAKRQMLVQALQKILQVILSTPDAPETDRPLIEMGLDSLMAVEFGTELQQQLGDQLDIGPTMLFDHPTIDAISDHILDLISAEESHASADTPIAKTPTIVGGRPARDDVAIVGMSCRFPGARNVDEFWENLLNGVDSICEIPEDRWEIDRYYSADREPGKMYTREGGFLDDIGDFDAAFFNISNEEACWIDPQHRLLLENSYRALEDAGIAPHPIVDSNVGVFMGIMGQDYAFLPRLDDAEIIKAFQGAGLSHSAGVGRISYVFGFEGPSIAVDTASSSSLVALIQAVRSLQEGNCNMALAGGVNAILAPVNSLLMSKANLLAPDGRCKSFSSQADGFGRGEGCGVVVLKRLSDAERDGDRIMAIVRGGAIVHNGFSGGITSPSGKSQTRVIGEALKDAAIAPSQVQYLEAHGTGTEFGDPMELGAAATIYGKGRQPDNPLLVGSVKANISHLEAAGGISGLIKTVLSLHHGMIPPQIHFDEPSSHIPWQRLPVKMVTEKLAWPEGDERMAGITALGLVGTNAHVILSAPAAETHEEQDILPERPMQLVVASARTDSALRTLVAGYRDYLTQHENVNLHDFCHTIAVGRQHHEHRVAFTVSSREDAIRQLTAFASVALDRNLRIDKAHTNGHERTNRSKTKPKLAWLFTGNAQSNIQAGRELYQFEPEFQSVIHAFDERLKRHTNDESGESLADFFANEKVDVAAADIHLFALQAGLAKLWNSWGIEPDIVLGFGVGQFTSACVAGCLCFMDAFTLVLERQKAIALASSQERQSALDAFEAFADTLNYYPPNLPLVCSFTGDIVPVHRSLGGSYWREQCNAETADTVALKTLAQQCESVLEIGPDTSVLPSTDLNVPQPKIMSSLLAKSAALTSMFYTLGRIYCDGANPDFKSFDKYWSRTRISLPTYPFEKKRFWITEIADHSERQSESIAR